MSKEMDELYSYFKAINKIDEHELFDKFNAMYKDVPTLDLEMKITETKLQINNAKISASSMIQNQKKTGNVHLDAALGALAKSMGIDKAIELSKLTVDINTKLIGVISSILATRELMDNANDEGENGRPEDDATDGETEG
jgi:hypothetical protein